MHVGPFVELPEKGMEPPGSTHALADDLRFVHRHLSCGGILRRLDHVLVVYRHHGGQLSHATPRELLMRVRARALESRVLSEWRSFSVWGAGRDAKTFLRCLSAESRAKVAMFAEVDPRKVGTVYENTDLGVKAPVVHFRKTRAPVIVCVARGRTGGQLERNVLSVGLVEGKDCWYFV
jgi:hypothetical protein